MRDLPIPIERLFVVLSRAVRSPPRRLNPDWDSVGKLLDRLAQMGEPDADLVVAWASQRMHADEGLTTSVFIGPFFERVGLPSVGIMLRDQRAAEREVKR